MGSIKTGIRWRALCLALCCATVTAAGQRGARPAPPPQTKQPVQPARGAAARTQPTRAAELEALVIDARSLPPEFAADVLLRLVESGRLTERAARRELLAEAFRTAGGAQQPVKRRIAPGLNYAYTREDYRARAFQLNLDALSLRLRAVNAMLKADKPRARALFDELPRRLPLAPLACADALVYDVRDFYETLTKVAQETFDAAEKERGEDLLFVQGYLDETAAPAGVWPAAQMVLQLGDTSQRFAPLLHAYADALKKIAADDDRSYTAESAAQWQTLARLLDACKRHGVVPDELLAAYRAYVVTHAGAARCADTAGAPQAGVADRRGFDYFNQQMREIDPGQQTLAVVPAEETRPARLEGAAVLTRYFTTPAAQALFRTAQELRFGLADEDADEAADDPKRGEKLTAWLNAMADWRPGGAEVDADYFEQKCVLYQLLLEAGPAEGPAGETLMREYVNFLRQPARQQENRAGWLLHVQRLLASPSFGAGAARARLLAALASSGDPVLRLYATLQKTRPPTEAREKR